MNSFHLSLLLLFSFVLSSYSQNSSNASSVSYCFPDQSSLLLQLKQEFLTNPSDYQKSSYQKLNSWNESKDCCLWDGVTCEDNKGYVIGLDLSYGGIIGRPLTPNSTLFNLRNLQKLNLAYSYFLETSAIPSELGRLTKLTHLNLSWSGFSGQIPPQLSWLTKLVSLDLSVRDYELQFGDLKFETLLKNLTNLRELVLNRVNISLSFPLLITNLSLESLHLGYCKLYGELPESIGLLTKLRRLSLYGNSFSGEIPSSLGNLTQLELIDFNSNNVHGSIPSSLGNLTGLELVDFSYNNLHGLIPPSLGNLTHLELIDFHYNNLNGSIPYSFANLKHLKMLDLSLNKLVGNIPVGLTNLTLLETLYLSDNQLTGPIPSSLGSMSNLIDLSLDTNSLTGMIPSSLFTIPSLTTIYLFDNKLSGPLRIENISSSNLMHLYLSHNMLNQPIPTSISKLVNLTTLDLSYQNISGATDFSIFLELKNLIGLKFSGNNVVMTDIISNSTLPGPQLVELYLSSCNMSKFPDFLRIQTQLQRLDLSNNSIEGQLPNWLSNIGENTLYILDISNNKLHGSIPLLPSTIQNFDASKNILTGTIPASICKLTYLFRLDLSDNNLDGTISGCWTTTSTSFPTTLNLASNLFTGNLSEIFTNISNNQLGLLESLDLGKNQFVGKIPLSLINCTKLAFLNLESNLINDTFPFFLGNLPSLEVLILRSNRFHGTISSPQNPSTFSRLRIIDISRNYFTGTLPSELFRSWSSMQAITATETYNDVKFHINFNDSVNHINFYGSVNLTNKGIEIFYGFFFRINLIDFSNNGFKGPIPESISTLKALTTLNLSSNFLTGHIPTSLVNLIQLESLDLSGNKLSGEIPQQLASLTNLSNIRMSDNQLTGHIPSSPQFESQPSSYFDGNRGLCGYPLEKCDYVDARTTEESDESTSDEEDFNWIAAAIGCIPGLLVGVTIRHVLTFWKHEWIERITSRRRPLRTTATAIRMRTR